MSVRLNTRGVKCLVVAECWVMQELKARKDVTQPGQLRQYIHLCLFAFMLRRVFPAYLFLCFILIFYLNTFNPFMLGVICVHVLRKVI